MKYRVMFLGGDETGNVDKCEWGVPSGYHKTPGGPVVFRVREPVVIDVDGEQNRSRKEFLAHLLKKAKTNRFFKVEEVKPGRPPSAEAA